jgi:hypothetical protein
MLNLRPKLSGIVAPKALDREDNGRYRALFSDLLKHALSVHLACPSLDRQSEPILEYP